LLDVEANTAVSETAYCIEESGVPADVTAGNQGGGIMQERKLTVAEILLIAGTRVALGAGIGLLLSSKLNNDQRKAAGLALAIVGGLTTIPLALGVMGKKAASTAETRPAA
jgi:hypothetical protein